MLMIPVGPEANLLQRHDSRSEVEQNGSVAGHVI